MCIRSITLTSPLPVSSGNSQHTYIIKMWIFAHTLQHDLRRQDGSPQRPTLQIEQWIDMALWLFDKCETVCAGEASQCTFLQTAQICMPSEAFVWERLAMCQQLEWVSAHLIRTRESSVQCQVPLFVENDFAKTSAVVAVSGKISEEISHKGFPQFVLPQYNPCFFRNGLQND